MGAIVKASTLKPIYKYHFSFFGFSYDLNFLYISEISRINDDGLFYEDINGIHDFNKEEKDLWIKIFVKIGDRPCWKNLKEDIVKKTDEDFKKAYKELLKKKEEERKTKEEEEKRKETTICGKIKKFFFKIL